MGVKHNILRVKEGFATFIGDLLFRWGSTYECKNEMTMIPRMIMRRTRTMLLMIAEENVASYDITIMRLMDWWKLVLIIILLIIKI